MNTPIFRRAAILIAALAVFTACDFWPENDRAAAAPQTSRHNENSDVHAEVLLTAGNTGTFKTDITPLASVHVTHRKGNTTRTINPLVGGSYLGGKGTFPVTSPPPPAAFGTNNQSLYRLQQHRRQQLANLRVPAPRAASAPADPTELLIAALAKRPEHRVLLFAPRGDYDVLERAGRAFTVVNDPDTLAAVGRHLWGENPDGPLLVIHRPVFPTPEPVVRQLVEPPRPAPLSGEEAPASGQIVDHAAEWRAHLTRFERSLRRRSERTAHHYLNQSLWHALLADRLAEWEVAFGAIPPSAYAYLKAARPRHWEATQLGRSRRDPRYLTDEPFHLRYQGGLPQGHTQLRLADKGRRCYDSKDEFTTWVSAQEGQTLTLSLIYPHWEAYEPRLVFLNYNACVDIPVGGSRYLRVTNATEPGGLPLLHFRYVDKPPLEQRPTARPGKVR